MFLSLSPLDWGLFLAGGFCIRRCQSSSFVPLDPSWNLVFLSAVIQFHLQWWVALNLAVREASSATSISSSSESCQREGSWSSLPEERLGHVWSETAVRRKVQLRLYAKVWWKGRISLFVLSNIFFWSTYSSALLFVLTVQVLFPAHVPPQASWCVLYNLYGVNSSTRATNLKPSMAIPKALSNFVDLILSEDNLSIVWLVF